MAFWQRKSNNRVFVYTRRQGKQTTLPRDLTRHLDHEPDHNVEAWVRQYEEQYEHKVRTPDQEIPPDLKRHVEDYLAYLKTRGKAGKTRGDHSRMLYSFILPYFLGHHSLADLNAWVRVSPLFAAWMRDEEEESEHQILRANSALRGFWEWACDENLILNKVGIRLRAPLLRDARTPLARVVRPEEMLAFIRAATNPDVKLMALLGYFFSLRPQETFALRRQDFVAGSRAAALECCRVMGHRGLFSRLAVDIHRQRRQDGTFEPPKAYSLGYVACFNKDAAELLVRILRHREADALLFQYLPDWSYEIWKRGGLGVTLKDLRRTSLYWLGHYTDMDLEALQNHARHKKPDTTRDYLRRPGERLPNQEGDDLDLDA